MYEKNLALNDLQWLICYKTKPIQTNNNNDNNDDNNNSA